MGGLADMLSQNLGASLDGDKFETSKEDKKEKSSSEIISKNQHQLVFTFEKRKGKPVTLVGRFYLSDSDKKDVLKLLKKKLACGGSIKEEWIELQGDVKDKIKNVLSKENWKFKN